MNITNQVKKFLILTLILLNSSCASLAQSSLLPLESRTYRIDPKCDGFIWQYNKCTRRFLGICLKSEIEQIKIEVEFKDAEMCKTLKNMNFILQQREKPVGV